MSHTEQLMQLRAELREVVDLESAGALLSWDQSTYMPSGGNEARARQLALLGRIAHERLTSPRVGELLEALRPVEENGGVDGALVRVARRRYAQATRLPSEFVAELKSHLAESYVAWTKARPQDDWAAIRPYLEKTVELSRRASRYYGEAEHIADPLIDVRDAGMTAARVKALFAELRTVLVPLADRIVKRPAPESGFLRRRYPKQAQLAFGDVVVRRLGYDFGRGRQDETVHPFMVRLAGGDIRITTRVREDDLSEALFSTIHETGHALYEQGIAPELDGTPLGEGVSAGVHESQSRLWENIVARSRPFWSFFFPPLQSFFPEELGRVSLDEFHRAINRVERSLIRTDADEVTYNLHVMFRFDLELALLDGELAVRDLPDAWDARMRSDLGLEPPDDKDGVLQDVHWYCESVGGLFQGYTLGNVMAAQFMAAAERAEPSLWEDVARGDFARLRGWLGEQVYRHGGVHEPLDLVERATGAPLSIRPFADYLKTKYGGLYGLSPDG